MRYSHRNSDNKVNLQSWNYLILELVLHFIRINSTSLSLGWFDNYSKLGKLISYLLDGTCKSNNDAELDKSEQEAILFFITHSIKHGCFT